MHVPSGWNLTSETIPVWSVKEWIWLFEVTSQSLTVLSSLPEAIILASNENWALLIQLVWPFSVYTNFLSATDHILIVLSSDADSTVELDTLNRSWMPFKDIRKALCVVVPESYSVIFRGGCKLGSSRIYSYVIYCAFMSNKLGWARIWLETPCHDHAISGTGYQLS